MDTNQTNILRPRFVALDSSHLAVLILDKYSSDPTRREKAATFESSFNRCGAVLLLTHHHIEELFRHRDEALVAQRVSYISSLPLVAWIASPSAPDTPGSVADIFAREAETLFNSPSLSLQDVRDNVAKSLFQVGAGQTVMAPFQHGLSFLKMHFQEREEKQREIVSISNSEFSGIAKTKVKDWLKGQLRSPADSADRSRILAARLSHDIRNRGDKRIPDADRVAVEFFEGVGRIAESSISQQEEPALQLLLAQDIDLADIDDDTTVADIGDLATFRRKLRIVNCALGFQWSDLKARVREDRVPTGVIQASLRKHGQGLPERKGSDLSDMYLACLGAYADITYVDKRTYENVRIARKKCPAFASIVRRVEKASGYWDIEKRLEEK